jgi:hypothetical protein
MRCVGARAPGCRCNTKSRHTNRPMQPSTAQMLPTSASGATGSRTATDIAGAASQDGQALVEFALVLPIVMVVLFGIVLFGFALHDSINETQLVSEAARFAAVNSEHGTGEIKEPTKPTVFLKWITEQGDSSNVQNATATICSPTSAVGDYVEVKLTYMYNWFAASKIFEVFGQKFSAATPLTSAARMRIEVPPSKNEHYPIAC